MGSYGADGVGDNDDDDGVGIMTNMLVIMVTIKASMVTAIVEKWC